MGATKTLKKENKKIIKISLIILVLLFSTLSVIPALPVLSSPDDKVPVIIHFRDRHGLETFVSQGSDNQLGSELQSSQSIKINKVYKYQSAVAAEVSPQAMKALKNNPAVKEIFNDLPIQLEGQTLPWGVDRIGAPAVQAAGNRGIGINVAILDSGIDKDHPDLRYAYGYDFSGSNDPDPEDYSGHGTHVAGTVAALDNGVGVLGVAPEANLYILKIFGDDGSGYYSDAIEALEWCIGTYSDAATGNEINVISMSWGSAVEYGDPGIEPWINQAYSLGILLVGAAGNYGNSEGTGDSVIYPARYANMMAVAATDSSDVRAYWSATGPDLELSAPGVGVYSTYLNGGYYSASGTSMACPHVSGTAALVFASPVNPEYDLNSNGRWDNLEVRMVMQATATDLGEPGKDAKYGFGLVDADSACMPPPPDTTPPTITNLSPPDQSTVTSNPVKVSASYHDNVAIDVSSVILRLDGQAVAPTTINSSYVEYSNALGNGAHSADLTVKDTSGNPTSAAWSFTVSVTLDYRYDFYVYDNKTGAPIQGAYVVVNAQKATGEKAQFSGYTESQGYVQIATGEYKGSTYTVSKSGYSTSTGQVLPTNTVRLQPLNAMHVGGMSMWINRNWRYVYTSVKVVDGYNKPVSRALVVLDITLPGGSVQRMSQYTGSDGTATFSLKAKSSGTYTSTVKDLVKNGWVYDYQRNVRTSESLTM